MCIRDRALAVGYHNLSKFRPLTTKQKSTSQNSRIHSIRENRKNNEIKGVTSRSKNVYYFGTPLSGESPLRSHMHVVIQCATGVPKYVLSAYFDTTKVSFLATLYGVRMGHPGQLF